MLIHDEFGRYLALGITTLLVVQAFFNISVVLGIFPTKGFPLPMISFGGSSLLVTLALLGILHERIGARRVILRHGGRRHRRSRHPGDCRGATNLRAPGHEALFVGTERGVEARLVPAAGFRLEKIRVGGIKNLGFVIEARESLAAGRGDRSRSGARFAQWQPAAVFSMGGYVAGPPVLAALARGVPVVVMEPNAVPGATNRWIAPLGEARAHQLSRKRAASSRKTARN